MSLRRFIQLSLVAAVATVVLALGSPAGAVDNPDYSAPVPSTTIARVLPAGVDTVAAGPTAPATSSAGLAITGSDIAQTAAIGAVLVAGGFVLVSLRRRQTA